MNQPIGRRAALAAALGAALGPACGPARAAAAARPPVLDAPALITPKALGAAMLAVARAGSRLVAVGERGTVLLSDDGGQRWRQAACPVQVSLTAVRFADERQGWAVGHLGVILKTQDGGERWVRQLDGVGAAERIAAAAASSGDEAARQRAARYVDEGPDKPFFDLEVGDAQHAVAVGAYGLAFATADGGASWQPLTQRLPNPKHLHLYAVRQAGDSLYIAGEQGLLLKSSDGGASFAALATPYKGSWFGLLLTRAGSLVAYGLRGRVFRSIDGGNAWQPVDSGVPVSVSAGIELAPGVLALLDQTGGLLLSRDDGASFQPRPPAAPLPATGLAAATDGQLVLSSLRGLRRQPGP